MNNRLIEVLKRAFPHLDSQRRRSINVILKMAELNDSINQFHNISSMEACDDAPSHVNTEELLRSIRPVCAKKEQEIIDFALNFNKTKDFYNTYKTLNNAKNINDTSDNNDSSFDNKSPFNNTSNKNESFDKTLERFKGVLSNDQLETINQLNTLINKN